MLLQTNSYIVPKDRRAEHARMIRRFRQTLLRLGCDHFEVYEQVGANWSNAESTGRYVQILRFSDRKHQLAVQSAERTDPTAQAVIAEFCELINFPYQQQQGLFAVGFYTSVLPIAPRRDGRRELVPTVEHEVVEDTSVEEDFAAAEHETDSESPKAADASVPPVDEDAALSAPEFIDGEIAEPVDLGEPENPEDDEPLDATHADRAAHGNIDDFLGIEHPEPAEPADRKA